MKVLCLLSFKKVGAQPFSKSGKVFELTADAGVAARDT